MAAPLTTTQFLGSLGVNVHVEYTDGKYANVANVVTDLTYLGETNVRDAVLNPANQGQSSYDALANAGFKFDFFWQGANLNSTTALVDAFVKQHPGSVALIEGPNEVNNFPVSYASLTGNAAATAYQAALYSTVKADALLSDVPVADLTSWPFLSGPSDDANYHFYPLGGEQPGAAYGTSYFSSLASLEPGKNAVMTEGGYNTLLTDSYFGGVDPLTQAKLILNLYCDNAKAGVSTTYVYQLLDAYADPGGTNSDDHFGLFNLDNSPKPAATAIHNLTSQLSSASSSVTATVLNYETSGVPVSGGLLDLTKNSSTHDLVLWAEPTIWNNSTKTEVAATGSPTTFHFDNAQNISVYDPIDGSAAIATYSNVHDISVTAVDHPLIIEVTASQASASSTLALMEGNPDLSSYFSPISYLDANQDVKAAGVDPLEHYDTYGWKEGRDPSANFDTTLYLLHNPDVAAAGVDPLAHYLTFGKAEGRLAYSALGPNIASDGFDAEYYLLANPDVAASGMDPHQHYLLYGWKEGRNPNGWFDDSRYLLINPDVAAAGVDPLLHYDQFGWKEGRDPSASFDTRAYLSAYSDVAAMGTNPLQYYLTVGAYNGHDAVSEGIFSHLS